MSITIEGNRIGFRRMRGEPVVVSPGAFASICRAEGGVYIMRGATLLVVLCLAACSQAWGAPALDAAATARIDAAVEQGIARRLAPGVA
ncbi:MAG: hypothetical protein KBC96_02510, partial [Armatimonadetes bacterium]|nr:hypothetical protein [Armatimonadota bacterium]